MDNVQAVDRVQLIHPIVPHPERAALNKQEDAIGGECSYRGSPKIGMKSEASGRGRPEFRCEMGPRRAPKNLLHWHCTVSTLVVHWYCIGTTLELHW